MEKELFRHDGILFFALMFTADKPARFRRHAQVKQLSDSGGINPHCHAARFHTSTELFRYYADVTIAVLEPDCGDVITAYTAVQAIADRAQIMNMLC